MKLTPAFRLLFLLSAATSAACSGRDAVTRDDLLDLEARVADLEQTNGRLRVRIQDTEEQLFLLQDRVEANRINMGRRDAGSVAALDRSAPPARPYASPVTAAVPPRPDVDPIANLPVQRLAPAPASEAPPGSLADLAPAAEEEVVIDMDVYRARFGGAAPAASRPPAAPSSVTGAGPRAQPPVDVGGYTLPVLAAAGAAPGPPGRDAATPPSVAEDETSPLAYYRSAVDLFNDARYDEALAALDQFIARAPEPDYMDNALYWMGESLYGLGRYDEALTYFQRVASEYPDGNKVPHALLKEALSWERLGNFDRARDVLNALVETYPSDEASDRARQRLRDL